MSAPSLEREFLFSCCQHHLDATVEFLRQSVAINSFTENPAGITRLAELTARQFTGLGFGSRLISAADSRFGPHLILKRPALAAAPTIALIAHLDAVYTEDEERRNDFVWRPAGSRIYGPGTNDIKGGTALIYQLLAALREAAPTRFAETNWVVLLNSCEEVISTDFGRVCREELPPETLGCLLFEADGGTDQDFSLVTARKGRATFRVTVAGRGAHAGAQHPRGGNAIVQLARVIEGLEQLTDYGRGLTVNVGSAHGGTVTNRVPHEAVAELEMRAFDPVVYGQAREQILAWNGIGTVGSAEDGFRCRVRVDLLEETSPWPVNAGTGRLFEAWHAAGHELGLEVASEERGGLSDGNVLWAHFPTLDGLGPRGENSHCSEQNLAEGKEQEWVDLESFIPKTALNLAAVLGLLQPPATGA